MIIFTSWTTVCLVFCSTIHGPITLISLLWLAHAYSSYNQFRSGSKRGSFLTAFRTFWPLAPWTPYAINWEMFYKYLDKLLYYMTLSPLNCRYIHFHHFELQHISFCTFSGYLLHRFLNNFAKSSMNPIDNWLRNENEIYTTTSKKYCLV